MSRTVRRLLIAWLAMLALPGVLEAAPRVAAALPARIAGNLYRLGAEAESAFLVTTPAGNVLINSGSSERSNAALRPSVIRAQMAALGFRFEDIKILLASHAHADHVGGHAAIRESTGASVVIMTGDEEVVRTGIAWDYGMRVRVAVPCPVDRVIQDRDRVELGGVMLTGYRTAGHTAGATTWALRVEHEGRPYDVLLLDSTMHYPGRELFAADYPDRLRDYADSLRVLKSLPADIALDPHGGAWRGRRAIGRLLETKSEVLFEEAREQLHAQVDPAKWRAAREQALENYRRWLAEPASALAIPELQVIEEPKRL